MAISSSATNASYFAVPVSGPACDAAKTVAFRVYITTLAGTQMFITVTNTTSNAYQFAMYNNMFRVWNFAGGATPVCSFTPTLNTWIHICYTYNPTGTVSTLYQNGVVVNTTTNAVNTGAVTYAQIGGDQWSEYSTSSYVEDMRLYNRVLTPNEVLDLANDTSLSTNVYGLSYWWPMVDLPNGAALPSGSLIEVQTHAASTLTGTAGGMTGMQTILNSARPVRV